MSEVVFDRVSKRFGGVTAVDDLSLEVGAAELMVLVGPSGCGKTTSLRMLAGLESVSSGTLRIGDRAVQELPPRDRDIAMVFQDYALYPQMTVFDNLAFGLRVRKVKRERIRASVEKAAATLDLTSLLDRKPRQLSGGQRQRVALGRALVRQPKAFLMDEPLSNLDAQLRAQTRGEIKALQQAIGVTTIYVTHDQVEAMTLGDRIAVMRAGCLEQVGSPAEVYERPANVFVAGFIGSPGMRFGRFGVSSRPGLTELVDGPVRIDMGTDTGLPDQVIIGVRPEHADLWSGDSDLVGPLQGKVSYIEALGRETLVGVRLGAQLEPVVEISGRCELVPGDRITIGLRRGNLHVFDSETEEALGRT